MCGCNSRKSYNTNRVQPAGTEVEVRPFSRVNGWTRPLHPLQFIGWFFISIFAVTHFGILVYYLPLEWISAGTIIPAAGYIIHLVYHFFALTLDPADPAVRKKGSLERAVFNKNEHLHVIENCYCHVCEVTVSTTSKHCAQCNKCVNDFDHHCKWLNNCVGGRNYKLFLGSCISAFLTALVMFLIDLYLFILYFTDGEEILAMKKWKLFVSTCKEAYIILVGVNAALLLIAMALLGHLILFHGYLICKDLSTYEYIVQIREQRRDLEDGVKHDLAAEDVAYYEKSSAYEMRHLDSGSVIGETRDAGDGQSRGPSGERNDSFVEKAQTDVELVDTPAYSSQISHEMKKKRKKQRSGSRQELLNSDSATSEDSTLSVRPVSRGSLANELERYNSTKNETILENFTTTGSQPGDEFPDPYDMCTRNESVASRPISPTPKSRLTLEQSRMETLLYGRSSQSSLSTVHLTDENKVALQPSPLTPPLEASVGSVQSTPRSAAENAQFIAGSVQSTVCSTTERSAVQSPPEGSSGVVEASLIEHVSRLSTPKRLAYGSQEADVVRVSSRLSSPEVTTLPNAVNIEEAVVHTDVVSNSVYIAEEGRVATPVRNSSSRTNEIHSTNSEKREIPTTPPNLMATDTLKEEEFDVKDSASSKISSATMELGEGESKPSGVPVKPRDFLVEYELPQEGLVSSPPVTKIDQQEEELIFEDDFVQSDAVSTIQDTDKNGLSKYVDAFKQKRPTSAFSYGSDSEASEREVPLSKLHERNDTYPITDTLNRVRKLSDAFPRAPATTAAEPKPMRSQDSMSEIQVVEYSKKKKIKKRRPVDHLPPLRGRKPLEGVVEEDRDETV